MSYTQRTANYVIQKAYLAAQRKSVMPGQGTTKYNVLLGLVDSAQDDWRNEPDTYWDSLYQTINTGTISTTDTYDLDDDIDFISRRSGDYITITNDTNTEKVLFVSPEQLYLNKNELAVARIGRTLKFSKPFLATSPYIGFKLNVPAYIFTDDITSGNTLVQCDDPMFLAYMVAAEFSRTDTVRAGQYNNLLDKAAERMSKMKQNNGGQIEEIPRDFYVMGETWN